MTLTIQNPEREILMAARRGDLDAWEKLIFSYERQIYNHLYRLCAQSDEAADLTQKTFLKIFKHRSKINQDANFRAYLYKIATNTAYDWFKKNNKLKEEFIIDNFDGPFETIESKYKYNRIDTAEKIDLETAIKKIPRHYQIVIDLYFIQGFSYSEISDLLNLPLNTIKTHLRRAKESLRKELEI